VKDTVQQRNYVEFSFTIQSFLPLAVLRHLLKFGAVTEVAPVEFMPIGKINNNLRYQLVSKGNDEDRRLWQLCYIVKFVMRGSAVPLVRNGKRTGLCGRR
jgi:hypothetical protein